MFDSIHINAARQRGVWSGRVAGNTITAPSITALCARAGRILDWLASRELEQIGAAYLVPTGHGWTLLTGSTEHMLGFIDDRDARAIAMAYTKEPVS